MLEVFISTIQDEPPSLFQRVQLTIQKGLTPGYRASLEFVSKYGKRLPTVLPVLFFCFIFAAQWQEVHAYLNTKYAHLAYQDSQQVALVLSDQLNLDTLTSSSHDIHFTEVSLKGGASIGGASTNSGQATPKQYVVKEGDTLSTIANSFDLHSGSLVLANPDIKDTEMIHPGEVLVIPTKEASETALETEYNDRLKKIAQSSTVTSTVRYQAPDSQGYISMIAPTSGYAKSRGFVYGGHTGDDLATAYGTPIVAAAAGCAIHVGEFGAWNGGYGNHVVLKHGGNLTTLYGHMSAYTTGMQVGACFEQGQIIGYVGSTGNSTGPHVHFEVRVNGTPVDPNPYY